MSEQLTQLLDMFGEEELHPDLKPYIEKGRHFHALKHPLVFQVPYMPHLNRLSNRALKQKRRMLEPLETKDHLDLREGGRYIYLHERPYRFGALLEIARKLDDGDFWELLGDVWTDTENLWQNLLVVSQLLASPRPGRERMMGEHERTLFDSLPPRFVVYRGHQTINRIGYSWSLSYGKARWFASRFSPKKSGVVRGFVNRADVHAVFLGRGEFEVAVEPSKVEDIQAVTKLRRPDLIQHLHDQSVRQFRLPIGMTHHGPWHWERVERNAIELCRRVPDADPLVCRLFAVLHDSQRSNEDEDPEHGERAAEYAKKVVPDGVLTPQQMEVLTTACAGHEKGRVSEDPTIGVCWDSDRLDLSRVGIIPDPRLLSTQPARELIWLI